MADLTPASPELAPRLDIIDINDSNDWKLSDGMSIRVRHIIEHGAFFALGRSVDLRAHRNRTFMVAAKFEINSDLMINPTSVEEAMGLAEHFAFGEDLEIDQCFIILPTIFTGEARDISEYIKTEFELEKDPIFYYFFLQPPGLPQDFIAEYSYTMSFETGLIYQTFQSIYRPRHRAN